MNKTDSRYIAIVDVLGPRIVDSQIAAGEVITLASIEAEFDCSRTVAREVQQRLESCGLVVAQRRVGLTVQPLEKWNVFHPDVLRWRLSGKGRDRQLESLTELRLAIEPHAAQCAARFATRLQRAEILHACEQLVKYGKQGTDAEFMKWDILFHRLILEYSGNEMFAALAPVIESVLTWRTQRGLMPPHPEPHAMEDHYTIAQAIYRGQPEVAADTMRDLVDEVQEAFRSQTPNVLRSELGIDS